MILPKIRLESISIDNFKIFDGVRFNFTDKTFSCLIGPNGTGKSTLLEIIQMLFFKFDAYTPERRQILLSNCIRRVKNDKHSAKNFKVEAIFSLKQGKTTVKYNVAFDKDGFITNHPPIVLDNLYKVCYSSTYDKELHKFQLQRKKWPQFKKLIEAVTGFKVKEAKSINAFEEFKDYIFDFYIVKPHENVKHKDFSDGEKKIVKSFASILNMEEAPSIILIDNIEMHVELKRHLPLIKELVATFPKSQIISTTHSYRISRTFKERTEIYDLRLINASDLIKKEPQRLYMLDEIDDLISRARCIENFQIAKKLIVFAEKLKKKIAEQQGIMALAKELIYLSKEINYLFLYDMASIPITILIQNNK